MIANNKLVPAGSQTVGPFFRIGLEDLAARVPTLKEGSAGCISIRGQVLDRDGAVVPDAMLEFWSPANENTESSTEFNQTGYPIGFRRVATDVEGSFSLVFPRPIPTALSDGRMQAPHVLVLVFARGLMRHLISRLYLEDDPRNDSDPLLHEVPIDRRGTLIARTIGPASYRWNVVLQGQDETVFFSW